MNSTNMTLEYYNRNAADFTAGTLNVDFQENQNRFLKMLNRGDLILDFGCGSGRDTKYFLEHGMRVEAIDGSIELCMIASGYTGIEVRNMLFQELDEHERYDAIWACSSILHLPKKELKGVLQKMICALKPDGIIYTSFKYGEFEGERNGRFFVDFTETSFSNFIKDIPSIRLKSEWVTDDVRPGRGNEAWLNLILQKE